ncbi:lipoxygenase [Powellomyces hirtus]|nr:lipoxygenase [Powellomyces hirtus]
MAGVPLSEQYRADNIGNVVTRFSNWYLSQYNFIKHYHNVNTTKFVNAYAQAFYVTTSRHRKRPWPFGLRTASTASSCWPASIDFTSPSAPETIGKNTSSEWFLTMMHATLDLDLSFGLLAVEPYAVAHYNVFQRQNPTHKISQVLEPHFKDSIGINAIARMILVTDEDTITDGPFSVGTHSSMTLLSRVWDNTTYASCTFKGALDEAGTDGSVVKPNYPPDAAVINDAVLRAAQTELTSSDRGKVFDFPAWDSAGVLTETLISLAYQCFAYHSSVNYEQYTYVGYVPAPTAFRAPMPFFTQTDLPPTT